MLSIFWGGPLCCLCVLELNKLTHHSFSRTKEFALNKLLNKFLRTKGNAKHLDFVSRSNRDTLDGTPSIAPEPGPLTLLGVQNQTKRRATRSFRRGLAIDVAVICPLAESHLGKLEPCESYAQNQKIARYVGAFENSDYDFAPVIFETSGAVNKEGETILKQVIRFASKREGVSHTVYASRAWARFSCCVQAASAQQILNRYFFDSEVAANSD